MELESNTAPTRPTGADMVAKLEAQGIKPQDGPAMDGTPAQPAGPQPKPAGSEQGATIQAWKDGETEYTPEQLREALGTHKRVRDFDVANTNRAKELAKIEAALDGKDFSLFRMTERLTKDSLDDKGKIKEGSRAAEVLDAIRAIAGDDEAADFEKLLSLKKSGLVDPREAELSRREAELNAHKVESEFNKSIEKLIGDNKLTPEEESEFVQFYADYLDKVEKDPQNPDLPWLTPEKAFMQSPLRDKKIAEKAKAEAIKEAEEKRQREDAAKAARDNNPPKTAAGAAGESKPKTRAEIIQRLAETVPQR